MVLRNILIKSSASASQASTISGGFAELNKMTEMIKFSSIIIAALPMLIIYPFVHFPEFPSVQRMSAFLASFSPLSFHRTRHKAFFKIFLGRVSALTGRP